MQWNLSKQFLPEISWLLFYWTQWESCLLICLYVETLLIQSVRKLVHTFKAIYMDCWPVVLGFCTITLDFTLAKYNSCDGKFTIRLAAIMSCQWLPPVYLLKKMAEITTAWKWWEIKNGIDEWFIHKSYNPLHSLKFLLNIIINWWLRSNYIFLSTFL